MKTTSKKYFLILSLLPFSQMGALDLSSNKRVDRPSTQFETINHRLIEAAVEGNIGNLLHHFKSLASFLETTEDPVGHSYLFLQGLIDEMNLTFKRNLTLPQLFALSKELSPYLENSVGLNYRNGLSLIENQISKWRCDPLSPDYYEIQPATEDEFWAWLKIATVTAGAVTVCIFCPQLSIPLLEGVIEIGKALLKMKNQPF